MWKCAVCGTDCEEALAVCPSCRSPRTAEGEAPDTARPRFCPICTRMLPAGETGCPYCSAEAPAGAGDTAPPPPSRRGPGTPDERVRGLQAFLRTFAWVAVVVNVFRGMSFLFRGNFPPSLDTSLGAWLSSSALLSSLWEAAYSWVILLVIAEALGMLFIIEENTRHAAGGTANRERSDE